MERPQQFVSAQESLLRDCSVFESESFLQYPPAGVYIEIGSALFDFINMLDHVIIGSSAAGQDTSASKMLAFCEKAPVFGASHFKFS
jgi:hypothetical protein